MEIMPNKMSVLLYGIIKFGFAVVVNILPFSMFSVGMT